MNMSPTRPFIETRIRDLQKEIDADLFLWLSGRKHPGVRFSGSMPLEFWGQYLDDHVRRIVDAAFITGRKIADENHVDAIAAVRAAGDVAESGKNLSTVTVFKSNLLLVRFPKPAATVSAACNSAGEGCTGITSRAESTLNEF